MKRSNLAIGILIAAIGVSGQAGATRQQRTNFQAAVNNCQAALPSFEGAFRKRPLGIANEGSSPAFISCALSVEATSSRGIDTVFVLFVNRGAAQVEVPCTLVDGIAPPHAGVPKFFPKIVIIPAGESRSGNWAFVADNEGEFFRTPSISCAIPPGVEINATTTSYDTDVGV